MTSTLRSTSLRVDSVLDIHDETAPDLLVALLPVVKKLSVGEIVETPASFALLESAEGPDFNKLSL